MTVIDPLRGPTEPCAYYEQPGHTPSQRPEPSTYLGRDPGQWPLCGQCAEVARHAAPDPAAAAAQRLERSRQALTVGEAIIALIPGAAGVIRP